MQGTAKSRPKYCIFRSWGRVGGDEEQRGYGRGAQTGGDLVHEHGEGEEGLRKALKEFHDQFRQKCAVAFVACSPPCQHPGGYNVALLAGQGAEDAAEVARQAAASGVAAGARAVEAKGGKACTLPAEVATFVSLIHPKPKPNPNPNPDPSPKPNPNPNPHLSPSPGGRLRLADSQREDDAGAAARGQHRPRQDAPRLHLRQAGTRLGIRG